MEGFIYLVCTIICALCFLAFGAILGAAYIIETEKKFKRPRLKIIELEPEDAA